MSVGAKRILRRKTSKRKAGGHLGTTPDGLLCHCLFIISPKTGSYKSLPIGPQDPNFPVKVDPLFFLYDKPGKRLLCLYEQAFAGHQHKIISS